MAVMNAAETPATMYWAQLSRFMDLLTEICLIVYDFALFGLRDITLWHPRYFRLRQGRYETVVEQNLMIPASKS